MKRHLAVALSMAFVAIAAQSDPVETASPGDADPPRAAPGADGARITAEEFYPDASKIRLNGCLPGQDWIEVEGAATYQCGVKPENRE